MTRFLIITAICLLTFLSCKQNIKQEISDYKYYDIPESETVVADPLIAVTDEEYLHFGSKVAYLNFDGDTIIPFGKYAYFGTDTLTYFATVFEHQNDSTWGRAIAIDKNQNLLFDVVIFDNGPESFSKGLLRVLRNKKMGFANKFGQIVIPCIYDYANRFEDGKAEVTLKATQIIDVDEHLRVESDEWFKIDRKGNKIE